MTFARFMRMQEIHIFSLKSFYDTLSASILPHICEMFQYMPKACTCLLFECLKLHLYQKKWPEIRAKMSTHNFRGSIIEYRAVVSKSPRILFCVF